MPAPAQQPGGAARPACLLEFRVKITRDDGQRIEYPALARNSLAALENALAEHGICKIEITPKRKIG